jgi:hypothetical protein
MLRQTGFKPKPKDVNCIFLNGGVGDHVGGSLIAVDYILKQYPWINLLVWVPDFLLEYSRNVLPKRTSVRSYTQMKGAYNPNRTTITTKWDGIISPMKIHLADYAFLKLCDEVVGVEHKNTLPVKLDEILIGRFELPKKYVCLATGFTVGVREFNAKAVNEIISFCVGKGYSVVFLGQTATATGAQHVIEGKFNEEIAYDRGINLINQTSLLQTAKIISQSAAMVGVDCGLLHIAGSTDTPIVGGYTTVRPHLRAPIRHDCLGWNWFFVEPEVSLECRFCQSDTNFIYDHNYVNCLYNDHLCVKGMGSEKFIGHLEKLL